MAQHTIQQTFDLAVQHHQAGRLQEAEQLYRQILSQHPDHFDAIQYLGVIAHQTGQHHVAIDLIRRAISLNPNDAKAHYNLALALKEIGQLDQSIAASRRAISLSPNYPQAYSNLGNVLKDSGQLDQSIAAFRQAISLKPNFADVHYNLGLALRDKGQLNDAIASFRQAISHHPNFPQAYSNLGVALKETGQLDDAITALREAISQNPDLPEAHSNLGNALREAGQLDQAVAAARQAISLRPNFAEAHSNLANALRATGQLDQAIAAYRRAISLSLAWAIPLINLGELFRELGRFEDARAVFQQAAQCEPDNSDAHNFLAIALAELQRFDDAAHALDRAAALAPDSPLTHEARGMLFSRTGQDALAVESFRRAIAIAPETESAWINLGQTLRQIGRFTEAADCFRQILARHPRAAQAYTVMASIGATLDPAEIARLTTSLDDPPISMRDRAALGFTLGKLLDDADRFDEAFAHYARANSLELQMRHAAGERYSSDQFARRVDDTIATWTPDFFARTRNWGSLSELPVFIVGIPRSGTSLVEQIAATHPDVFGAGELRGVAEIAASLNFTDLHPASIQHAAAQQLNRLQSLGGPARRVIDKMPFNVERLGLIATLFPSARIILCRRDPRDTCLSCFFQNFSSGNLFSFDLTQCGRHHLHTDRLIAHWQKVLPLPMLDVQYEDLIADLETQTRRIISFLNLPWNPACLDFHRTQRTVLTFSAWQVRQPIYTRSVARWRNYQRHLSPLFEALGFNK